MSGNFGLYEVGVRLVSRGTLEAACVVFSAWRRVIKLKFGGLMSRFRTRRVVSCLVVRVCH